MLHVIMVHFIMLNVIMVNVIMLHVIRLHVIILNVIMLNVIILNVTLLTVIILNVVMLNVVTLNVVMLNVIILNVVAPLSTIQIGMRAKTNWKATFSTKLLSTPFHRKLFHRLGQIYVSNIVLSATIICEIVDLLNSTPIHSVSSKTISSTQPNLLQQYGIV
jgi:hypothetical protein